jgi:hypothetical protein
MGAPSTGASPHALDNALTRRPGARGDDVDLAADAPRRGNAYSAAVFALLVEAVFVALVAVAVAVIW